MRIQIIILTLLLSIFPLTVIAGADHDHGHSHDPVSQLTAEETAIKIVIRMADEGKIDKTWNSVGVAKSEQKEFSGHKEWVISFRNTNISDSSKQMLYVFLSLTGDYIAANYSGE